MTEARTLPATHVAMYYVGDGSFRVRRDPVPVPGPGQVLTAVEVAGLCGTDLHITQVSSTRRHDTEILGHEFWGQMAKDPSEPREDPIRATFGSDDIAEAFDVARDGKDPKG